MKALFAFLFQHSVIVIIVLLLFATALSWLLWITSDKHRQKRQQRRKDKVPER